MKHLLWIPVLIALLLLGACGGTAEAPAEEAAEPEAAAETEGEEAVEGEEAAAGAGDGEPFRVAVVMPSATTDLAWSQAMYDALLEVQEEMGGESAMEISFSENMFNVTDAAAALRDYAADGNDLIIGHGTQYGTSLFEVAADFPETSFAWGTATDAGESEGLENVFAYDAQAAEGGFVNGVIAANLSEAGTIGVIGPVEAGDAQAYIDGFVNGVLSVNPDADVQVAYTGSFGDTALAAETANVQIAAGADVLTGSAQQVVSDCVGARQLIDPGNNGFVYPCGDVAALAATLRTALGDRDRLATLGAAARERLHTWSPRENVAAQLYAIESSLARRAGAATAGTAS